MEFAPKLVRKETIEKAETLRTLEPAQLKRLIFMSYMFSQGEQEVQLNIFRWLKQYYGPQPTEVIAEAHHQFVESQFQGTPVSKLEERAVHAPGHITEHRLDLDYEFITYLSSQEADAPDIKYMQREMYTLDLHYLQEGGGRPNRKPEGKENTLADPYFSFVVQYLVRLERTGDEAMDALCKHLGEEVAAIDKDSAESLIALYNKTHPDTQLSLQELSRIYRQTVPETVTLDEAA